MNRSIRLISFLALPLLLAACMSQPLAPKEPKLTYAPVTHDVHYARHTVIPSDAEDRALQDFLAQHGNNPGGNIALLAADPGEMKTAERLGDLRRQLEAAGYVNVVAVQDTAVPAERIRVSASELSVAAPDCPDWSDTHMENYRNAPLSNMGCASAVNFGKMVANPNDLAGGNTDHRPDATRTGAIIESYRTTVANPDSAGGAGQSITGGQ